MKAIYYGIEHPHSKGAFCKRTKQNLYGIFYFKTSFVYEKDGSFVKGQAGDLLLSAPYEVVCHGPISSSEAFFNDWLYITEDLSSLLKKYPIPCSQNIFIGRQKVMEIAISSICDENNKKQVGYEEKINSIITQLIIDLYRLCQNNNTPKYEMIIEKVWHTVMLSVEKDWTLSKMAELSGYSESHFSKLFVSHFGISPKAKLLEKRLSNAKQLLLFSSLSVGEIAEKCGFKSLYYFSKYFKQKYGCPPSKYAEFI